MRLLFLFLLCLPLSILAGGDLPLAIFKTIGTQNSEEGKGLVIDSNGLLYVLSSTNAATSSHTDVVLTCMDSNMNCMWSNVYGTSSIEQPAAIVINSEDQIFISGTQLHPNSGGYDIFVMTISLDGTLLDYQSYIAPSWQIMHKMALSSDQPLLLIEDFASADRFKLLNFNADQSFSFVETGGLFESRIPTAIKVVGQELLVASHLENTLNEVEFDIASRVYKMDMISQSTSFVPVTSDLGNVVVHDMVVDSEGNLHVAGDVQSNEVLVGYYGSYDSSGSLLLSYEVVASDDYSYTGIFVTSEQIILPGYLKFTGAGKKDAFVMILNIGGVFMGAPTYGGTEDDFFVAAQRMNTGELYCVGTSFSYNGETGDAIVLKLSETASGDYEQIFDFNNDCLIVEVEEEKHHEKVIESVNYFDLMGRKCQPGKVGYQQIYLKVTQFSNGETLVEKVFN